MPSRSPLVGREREMETLRRLGEQASLGRGSVALLEGEPGIGKSRLLGETLRRARDRGFNVFSGAGEELERDRPFGPIAAALGIRFGAADPRRSEIARLLGSGGDMAGARERGPALRYQVLESILALVEDLSAERPLILALDDVQWADPSTLLVARHLGRRVGSLAVLLVMASRPVPRAGDLRAVIETLRGEGLVTVELAALSAEAVVELAVSLSTEAPGPALLGRLSGASGNPLLVTELMAALEAGRRPPDQTFDAREAEVPRTFADSVMRRLRFLSADAFQVLRHASVLGTVFSAADLAVMLGRPPTALLGPLDEARNAGLLTEADDRLRFRHDLVRDAVYADLPVSLRQELHAHAARELGAAGRGALQIAAHVTRGATQGDEAAIRWLRLAAKETLELEPAVAADLLERARAIGGPTSTSRDLLTDLLIADVWSGRLAEAESLGSQLLATDRQDPETDLTRVFLARTLMFQGRAPEALRILEPALHGAGAADGARARLCAMGSILRTTIGDVEGARVQAEEGIRAAERSGDTGDEALNIVYLAMAERSAGNPRRAVDLASRAVALVERPESAMPQMITVYNLAGMLLTDADKMDEAESALQIGRQLTEDHGTAWGQAECHVLLAERHLCVGQWDDAVAEAETTVDLCEMFGAWHAFGAAQSTLAIVRLRRNELRPAQDHIERARARLALAPVQHRRPSIHWATGLLLEAKGDHRGALSSLDSAWTDSAGIAADQAAFGPDLVRLAINVGERHQASDAAATLAAAAKRAQLPRIDAAALLCRGLIDDDPDILKASVVAFRQIARPYELARACEAAGAALGRGGSRQDAIAYLRESIEIYERPGATRDVARADASLRALGVRRGSRSRMTRPATGWESLTRSESSVAQLVADGLRNREIADRLFVSRRTVETHLTHVFGKLEISSRTELVAMARRQPP